MSQKVTSQQIVKYRHGESEKTIDLLAVEEPLEIRIGYGSKTKRIQKSLAVTMRTPGDDEQLALGFLFTENIIQDKAQILSVKPCVNKETGELEDNILRVELSPETKLDISKLSRNFYTTSSCGVCGKASLELIDNACSLKIPNSFKVKHSTLLSLSNQLNNDQSVFNVTGGIHATALFNANGEINVIKEDVGRHNAFDKIVGDMFIKTELPLFNSIALVSGRTSFELLQKAAMAGIPILCAIGAPSSLAVDLANKFNITLIGFLKEERFNIYTHPERIIA